MPLPNHVVSAHFNRNLNYIRGIGHWPVQTMASLIYCPARRRLMSPICIAFLHDRGAVDPVGIRLFRAGDDERSLLDELSGPSWAPKLANGHPRMERSPRVRPRRTGVRSTARQLPPRSFRQLKVAVRDSIARPMLISALIVSAAPLATLDRWGWKSPG